jgi:hypothetical protein
MRTTRKWRIIYNRIICRLIDDKAGRKKRHKFHI